MEYKDLQITGSIKRLESQKINLLWKIHHYQVNRNFSNSIYNASCLHVHEYVIRKVNTELFQFLCGSGREKVKRDTVIRDMENGNLNMVNLKTQIQDLKIRWISGIYDREETSCGRKYLV